MKCILCGFSTFHTLFPDHGRQLCRCLTCGLVQIVPMPDEKEIHTLYHEDFKHFDPYIAQIPVHRAYFQQKVREIGKRGVWLDIGCALGILLDEAKKAGYRAVGVDISHDAVSYCKKKKLDVYEGTIVSVGKRLTQDTYTVVSAFEIIEHERDPLGMMRRIHTLLKNGGITILTTPNYDGFWRKCMGRWWVGYYHPEHVTFWNKRSLIYLLTKAGFMRVTVRRDTPRPFPLSFAFTRMADYTPWAAGILKLIGTFLHHVRIKNPINPWDDLLVVAKKE